MSNKKVAIITLYGDVNFGNKLQNYALQENIKSLGYDVETLRNVSTCSKDKIFKKKFIFIRKIKRLLTKKKIEKIDIKRKDKIKIFSDKFLSVNPEIINEKNLKSFSEKYNYFCYGSDQIWNPYISQPFSICLGTFAPKNKNIAYAPSLSVNEIPTECENIYIDALANFKALSCREKLGAELIKKVSNRECKVVLDPVFLLSKKDWIENFDLKRKIEEHYIFIYFIGGLTKEMKKELDEYACSNNLKIVDILDKNNELTYVSDPVDFLSYIYYSDLVITDSFHATAFSIIFNKDFFVLNRLEDKKMFSRIESILSLIDQKNRVIKDFKKITDKKINYENVNKIIGKKIEESKEYLKDALIK